MKKIKTIEELQIEINKLESKISELERSNLQNIWLENSPVSIKILDKDFNLQYMNPYGVNELKVEDITRFYGKPYPLSFYPDVAKNSIVENLRRAKDTGETIIQEVPIEDRKGNTLWHHSTIMPVYNDNNELDSIQVLSSNTFNTKYAETTLQENYERFHIAFNQQFQFMAILSPEGYTLEINDLPLRAQGLKRDDYIGKLFWKSPTWEKNPELQHKIKSQVMQASVMYEPLFAEDVFLSKDGTQHTALATYNAIRDKENNVRYILAQATDITGRKQDEEKLKESEERFRSLYNNSPLCYHGLNEDGSFKDVNVTWLDTLGYERSDVIGKFYKDFLHPDWQAHFEVNFSKFKKYGYVKDIQFKIRHKSGHYLDIILEGRIGYNPDGSFKQTYSVFKDITDSKKAEEKLKASIQRETELADIVRTAPIGIAFGYPDGRLDNCNSAFSELTGYTISELQEINWNEVLTPSNWNSIEEQYLSKLSPSLKSVKYEKEYIHKDGHIIPIELTASAKFDSEGNLLHYIGFVVDITERKQFEQEREQLLYDIGERMKELNCLYSVDKFVEKEGTTLEQIFEESIKLIPPSWQFPEITCAKITFMGKEYKTNNFIETKWKQLANIRIQGEISGEVCICYLEEKSDFAEGPFLKEERILIEALAKRFGEIIEKKQAEEELRESEKHFRTIYDSTPAMLHSIDKNGLLISVSEFWLKTMGYEKDEVLGKPPTDFLTESSKKYAKDIVFPKLYKNDFITNAPYQFVKKSGELIDILLSAILIRDNAGEMNRALAVLVDITDSNKTEKSLKESEERFELAMAATKDGLFDWNLETNTIYYSPGWKRMLGYKDYELPNDFSVWEKLTKPEDIEKSWKMQQEVINKQRDRFELEFKMKHKDGYWVDILSRADAMFDENGKAIRMVGTHVDITERKLADQAILLSSKRYESLFNDSPIPLWEEDCTEVVSYLMGVKEKGHKDLHNYFENNPNELMKCAGMIKILDVNKAALDLHKASNKEHLIGNLSDTFTESSFTVFKNELVALLEGKETFESEAEIKTLDGELKNIHLTLKIDKSQADEVKALLATSDITERKQAEEKLIESMEHLNLALEGANAGLWSWNIKTGEDLLDERWCGILGYTKAEIRQHVSIWESLMHPDDKDRVMNVLKMHFEDENIEYKEEYRMKCKNGKWKWIFAAGKVVERDKEGKPARMTGVIIDIAEQKLAEEKMRVTEQNLQNTFDISPSIIAKANINTGCFIEGNQAVTRILGYSIKEFTSIPYMELIHPDNREQAVNDISNQASDKAMISFENKFLCKDGSYIWMSWHGTKADENGLATVIGSSVNEKKNTEIELKNALEKALESDRLKSAFLANMSHEIRTPMNGILGFANLLNTPNLSKIEVDKYSDIINKSGARLLNTINDIIDISRIESGQIIVSRKETSIHNLLDELYSFHSSEAKQKGLALILEPTNKKEVNIVTDDDKLYGILTNLIKNAIKYTPKGTVTFGCIVKDKRIQFFVKDTGIGIPKGRLHAIFNRFEQADIEDKRVFEGSGLGLAISKAYVEMLDGDIEVESELGKGSKFRFTIPLLEKIKREPEELRQYVDRSLPGIENLNLLIVEDDMVSAELLKTMLEDRFHEITHVQSGVDAVEMCKNMPDIDLVLMDIQMPVMGGYDATRGIREFNKDLVIIAQTAYALVGDKEKAIQAGCNDYITKPINEKLLLEMINKHLE